MLSQLKLLLQIIRKEGKNHLSSVERKCIADEMMSTSTSLIVSEKHSPQNQKLHMNLWDYIGLWLRTQGALKSERNGMKSQLCDPGHMM